ncbi:MAG: hypothetical protein Q8R01_04980 [Ramlibacter sp.]|nr:hypothetical protein [Ramlibacter sp.]
MTATRPPGAAEQVPAPGAAVVQAVGVQAAEVQAVGVQAAEVQAVGVQAAVAQAAAVQAAAVQAAAVQAVGVQAVGVQAVAVQAAGVQAAVAPVDRLALEDPVEAVEEVLAAVPLARGQAARPHRLVGAWRPPARVTASAPGRRRVPRWAKHPRRQASALRPAS